MEKAISHKGRVLRVEGDIVSVEIVSHSACSGCHASGLCGMSEAVKKIVEVTAADADTYSPGETVEVILSQSMGMKAVLAGYVAPLLVLMTVCVTLSYTSIGELWAGLAGLGGVALYYLCLYLARGHFAKEYVFRIRKENNFKILQ